MKRLLIVVLCGFVFLPLMASEREEFVERRKIGEIWGDVSVLRSQAPFIGLGPSFMKIFARLSYEPCFERLKISEFEISIFGRREREMEEKELLIESILPLNKRKAYPRHLEK